MFKFAPSRLRNGSPIHNLLPILWRWPAVDAEQAQLGVRPAALGRSILPKPGEGDHERRGFVPDVPAFLIGQVDRWRHRRLDGIRRFSPVGLIPIALAVIAGVTEHL